MRQDREQHNPGSPHLGPVTPPSLGEVYEISTRRQRTRYRFIQGTLVAVAVAGVGVGLQSRSGDSIQSPANTGEQAAGDPADDAALADAALDEDLDPQDVDPEELDSEAVVDPAAAMIDCPPSQTADGTADWMENGRITFLEESASTLAELESLADQWQIPVLEVKGLAGVASEIDAVLVSDTLDEAFFDWYDEGYTAEQLNALADEWNVTSISVKILQLLGGPQAEASLTECGLS